MALLLMLRIGDGDGDGDDGSTKQILVVFPSGSRQAMTSHPGCVGLDDYQHPGSPVQCGVAQAEGPGTRKRQRPLRYRQIEVKALWPRQGAEARRRRRHWFVHLAAACLQANSGTSKLEHG